MKLYNKICMIGLLTGIMALADAVAGDNISATSAANGITFASIGSGISSVCSTIFIKPGKWLVDYIQSPSGDIVVPDNAKYVALTLAMGATAYKLLQVGLVERAQVRTISNFWNMGLDSTLLDTIYSARSSKGVKSLLFLRPAFFARDVLTVTRDVLTVTKDVRPAELVDESDETDLVETELGSFIVTLTNDSFRFCKSHHEFAIAKGKRSLHALHALAEKHLLFFEHASYLRKWVSADLIKKITDYKNNLAHNLGITEYKQPVVMGQPAIIQQANVVTTQNPRRTLADMGRLLGK